MSLRKASGVRVVKSGYWFFAEHCVVTSKGTVGRLDAGEHGRARTAVEAGGVAEVAREHDRVLWWASDGFYWAEPAMTSEDVALLLWDRQRRHDARLERLRKIRAREEQAAEAHRARHPHVLRDARRGALRPLRGGGGAAVRPRHPCGEGRRQLGGERAGAVRRLQPAEERPDRLTGAGQLMTTYDHVDFAPG